MRYYSSLCKFFANQTALRDEAEDLAQATLLRAYERINLYTARSGRELRGMAADDRGERLEERSSRAAGGETGYAGRGRGDGGGGGRSKPDSPRRRPAGGTKRREAQSGGSPAGSRADACAARGTRKPASRHAALHRAAPCRDLKYQEIASRTGIGLNSVRSQLFEARQRLKPILDHYFQGQTSEG